MLFRSASRQATAQYARAGIRQSRMASVIPREAIGELRAAANPGVLDPNASLRVSDPAEIWPRDLPRLYDPTSEVQFPARPLTVDSVREALGVDQTASVIGRAELNTRGLYDRAANGLARLAGKGKGAVDTLGGRIQGIRQPDLPELPDFEGLANPPALPTGQALADLGAAVQTGQDVLADTSARLAGTVVEGAARGEAAAAQTVGQATDRLLTIQDRLAALADRAGQAGTRAAGFLAPQAEQSSTNRIAGILTDTLNKQRLAAGAKVEVTMADMQAAGEELVPHDPLARREHAPGRFDDPAPRVVVAAGAEPADGVADAGRQA